MESILNLYGSFILTLLGFVLPILSIAIAMLPEGVNCVKSNYENEKKQTEENLLSETDKFKDQGLDIKNIEKNVKILKKKKREAILKLRYLNPKNLVVKILIPFTVTLVIIGIGLRYDNNNIVLLFVFFSFFSTFAGLLALWQSISIFIEVSSAVNQKRQGHEERLVELLTTIASRGSEDLFLKKNQIGCLFNNTALSKDSVFEFSVNNPHPVPVSIHNQGELMAKNVEIGFIFPKDFLIEETKNISIYTDESSQIVRIKSDMVQAHENNLQGKINITFLKVGEYKIASFIKGENVKYNRFTFTIKVIQ
jgi:hypothetical protein